MMFGVTMSPESEACTWGRRRRFNKSRTKWRRTMISPSNTRTSIEILSKFPRKVKIQAEHWSDSLSEWEIQLRDVLGLRKKLKKSDWPVVYQHVKHREDQGKEWGVYIRNYRIEKKRAWREMRRNGALRCPPRRGIVTALLRSNDWCSIRSYTHGEHRRLTYSTSLRSIRANTITNLFT